MFSHTGKENIRHVGYKERKGALVLLPFTHLQLHPAFMSELFFIFLEFICEIPDIRLISFIDIYCAALVTMKHRLIFGWYLHEETPQAEFD